MKKSFSRNKLDLNKQTIATLSSVEMRIIQGGASKTIPTCCPCPLGDPSLDTDLT